MNLTNFFGQSNGQTQERSEKRPPDRVLKVPSTELEGALWYRDGRYGKQASFSISGKSEAGKLYRTFSPEQLFDVALTVYVLSRYFSQHPEGVTKKAQAGLADLAGRLETLFSSVSSKTEEQPIAQAPNGVTPVNGVAPVNGIAATNGQSVNGLFAALS